MSRRDDLERSIAKANQLIHEYQDILRESESPKQKARARREIAELHGQVKEYQAELNTLIEDGKSREEQTQHPQPTHIDTGGGMYVAGNVINRGVMVGRDQQVDGDVVLGDKVGGDKSSS